ncbi:malate permease [Lachnospiraceae bacterium KM106-2]|nr:malate permease [Lachnospiraceae bacterium KM106-2]
MILFKQMIMLFVIMILGYVMARKKILDDHTSKSISWIIVNVANPALILSGALGGNTISKKDFLTTMVVAFLVFFGLILIAECLIPAFRLKQEDKGVYKIMLVFSNIGFMGFPIISALYGTKALLYGSVFLLVFNVLIYTYGIMSMSKQKMSLKGSLRKCFNIGVAAGIASFVISFCQIPLPETINQIITMLSSITAPLSMMVIGASFIHIELKEIITDWKLLFFACIKLLVLPIVGINLIRLFTDNIIVWEVSMVLLATPSGSMAAMLAQQFGGNYETASKGIAVTTLLSVVTMPLVFMVAGL